MKREKPGPGQESVWDYPRPPRLELSSKTVTVKFAAQLLARTSKAFRVLETSHPPAWYLPPEDVNTEFLIREQKQSFCEWKGSATYWTVRVADKLAKAAAWSYESPTAPFAALKGYLAFYPAVFSCLVDGEPVQPQPGSFYGGWVTHDVVGPFKGVPGSSGW